MKEKTAVQQQTVHFKIDGKDIAVPKGTTVYQAARQLGIEIPIFCYQDRMPPFGACRVCLVEVEKMNKLQASCTLEATEGMVVNTQSGMAVQGRKEILELLLINHPLDCPICDRAGECPLQDQAQKFGPGESRFFEDKRHFYKPLPLGPVLMLDRERCIQCARCTRFGDLVAGDHALEFIDRGYRLEVGTLDGGPPQSKFIGNTIMICPVGALTSQVYRFRARPWDNERTKSTCTLCPVGCSLKLDERDGEIMRTRTCENREVNDIWLCDKGWFGYEFTYSQERLTRPLIRRNGTLEPASWEEALNLIASHIKEAKPHGKLAAFGGNPLTVEENYLFQQLMRKGAGINHVDHRIGTPMVPLDEEGKASGMEISIGECEELDFILILGVDLTEEFPVVWLRMKQAINCGAKTIFIGHYIPEIAKHLTKNIIHAPGEELETLKQHLPEISELAKGCKKSAIFLGRQFLDNPQRLSILAEIEKVKTSLPNSSLNIMEGRGNSFGARFAGMRPDIGPMGEKLKDSGLNALEVLEEASKNGWDFLYVAGANPAVKFPAPLWEQARKRTKLLVVQDLFMTETALQADIILPTLSFVEKRGSFINIEGRVQKLHPGKEIPDDIYSDSEIFTWIGQKIGLKLDLDKEFKEALNEKKISLPKSNLKTSKKETHAANNKSSIKATFAYALFDHGVRMLNNPHLVELSKLPFVRVHPDTAKSQHLQEGVTVRLSAKDGSISVHIKMDKGVAPNTFVVPLGFPELHVHNLGKNLYNGLELKIEKVQNDKKS